MALYPIGPPKEPALSALRSLASAGTKRWLMLLNGLAAGYLGLAFVAPMLAAAGRPDLAGAIYALYGMFCHEWPFRSYFLFGPQIVYSADQLCALGIPSVYSFHGSSQLGYEVAFCARDVALYGSVLLTGIAYALRRSTRPLAVRAFLLLAAPMALDGLTQLVGWRESTWELRTLTGFLFGLGFVWLVYPRLDAAIGPSCVPATRPAGAREA